MGKLAHFSFLCLICALMVALSAPFHPTTALSMQGTATPQASTSGGSAQRPGAPDNATPGDSGGAYAAAPYLAVLFKDDFTDDLSSFFDKFGDDTWEIRKEKDNAIYCLKTDSQWSGFKFGQDDWSDYSVELRAKLVNWDKKAKDVFSTGKLDLGVRGYVSDLTAVTKQVSLWYDDNSGNWKELDTVPIPVAQNTWFTLRNDVSGDHVLVFFDGKAIFDVHDSARTKPDRVGITTSPTTELCIDDIVVRSLNPSQEAQAAATTGKIKSAGSVKAGTDKADAVVATVSPGMSVFVLDQNTDKSLTLIRIDQTGVQGWITSDMLDQ